NLDRCRAEIIFHQHIGHAGLLAVEPSTRKNPVGQLAVGCLLLPPANKSCQRGTERNGSFAGRTFRRSYPATRACTADGNLLVFVVTVCPLQAEAFRNPQSRDGDDERESAFRL